MILFAIASAWLAGVIAAALGGAALWPLLVIGGGGLAVGFLAGGQPRLAAAVAALALVALTGVVRYEEAKPSPQPRGVAVFNGGAAVTLRGTLVDEPEERGESQRFTLRVDAYRDGGAWRATEGKVLVTAPLFPRFAYGDELELRGELLAPPSFPDFDYREYLARRGVVSLAAFPVLTRIGAGGGSEAVRALNAVRQPLSRSLKRSLPAPESALARGILMGERASIPAEVTEDFNRSGISHLVAISGYNVALVAGLAAASFAWLIGRRPATLIAMLLVVAYALAVGATPSVLRATLMGELMLGAVLAGRPGSALGAVLLAGAALTAWQPLSIDDVAFQLSFAATIGIVVLAGPLAERLRAPYGLLPEGLAATLAEQSAVTIAASVAVLPVIAAIFGRVSIVSLPANLLAVPLFPLALLASAVTAVAGAVSGDLGYLTGEGAYLPLAALIWLGHAAAALPQASVTIEGLGTLEAALLYAPLLLLAVVLARHPAPVIDAAPALRMRPALIGATALLILAAWVWSDGLTPESRQLAVTILDVGQGDAILIQAPGGRRVLIDGGPAGERLMEALGGELPAGARRIDLVVLTHGQDDHVSGLVTALERFDVGAVLAGPLPGSSAAYQAWRDALAQRRLPLRLALAGDRVDLGGGARLEVLAPGARPVRGAGDDQNDNSVVLRLVYGEVSFLLTGDLGAAGEAALLARGGDLRATVLKVAHHGSDSSTTPSFLAAVRPRLAVVSVGGGNGYGHPSPSTELALRLAGVAELRTDANGRVRLTTDGRELRVHYQRGGLRAKVGGLPTEALTASRR